MTDWDIKKLQILRTLNERGTVTATAEALLMTPSAVAVTVPRSFSVRRIW
ncbi:LysR family transcriptional regulator, partial [Streptomyces lunaelactis]|nr:LysR family transcriptional regulator [Streptomyces lunaelactis]